MKFIWIILSAVSLLACQSQESTSQSEIYHHIADEEARNLLMKAMNAAGGLDRWQSKQLISFQKYVALYDSSGVAEQEDWQRHTYHYLPEQQVEIEWEKDSAAYRVLAKNGEFSRFLNDVKDTTVTAQSVENSIRSATFVISLPFKLLDSGVVLTHKGKKQLDTGQSVEILEAVYDAEQHEEHTNQDIWELYFDAEDYKMLAYQVQHEDHISYVLNESFHVVDGIVFPHHRKSFRMNENGEHLFLRAAYEYKDFEMIFETID